MTNENVKKKAKPKTKAARTTKKPKPLTPMDIMKLEIAEELGLTEKVKKEGWAGLTAAETGRIGGIMTSRIKKDKQSKSIQTTN